MFLFFFAFSRVMNTTVYFFNAFSLLHFVIATRNTCRHISLSFDSQRFFSLVQFECFNYVVNACVRLCVCVAVKSVDKTNSSLKRKSLFFIVAHRNWMHKTHNMRFCTIFSIFFFQHWKQSIFHGTGDRRKINRNENTRNTQWNLITVSAISSTTSKTKTIQNMFENATQNRYAEHAFHTHCATNQSSNLFFLFFCSVYFRFNAILSKLFSVHSCKFNESRTSNDIHQVFFGFQNNRFVSVIFTSRRERIVWHCLCPSNDQNGLHRISLNFFSLNVENELCKVMNC